MKRALRLLIADDEKIERDSIRLFASSFSPPFDAIEEASNGIEAVEAAREFRPDIIIMDIRMPGKTGVEAAEAIRSSDSRVRILFLTAFGELEYARAAFKVRADDFMVKPVSEVAFREALGRAVLSLEEAGALEPEGTGLAVTGVRNDEAALLEAIRHGLPDDAQRAASRLFDSTVRLDSGVQEARRAVRGVLASIDRSMSGEFGRSFEASEVAVGTLRDARDRSETRISLQDAARAFATEVASLKADPHRMAIDDALAFIAEHWHSPITLEDASKTACMSKFHFSRIFHAATGTTFTEYLCAKRIEHAKALLADPSLPMKQICDLAGFGNPTYFSSAFRKREGMSPSEYRTLTARRKVPKPLMNQSRYEQDS
jgi:two-component system, response regulator YesN